MEGEERGGGREEKGQRQERYWYRELEEEEG